ncbi:hypothetical protein H735_08285 [Vibrio owensii CAIM 1854 = LMG 25443]|uniref:Uncharacterized protein n=1 Tax=Vibrio owensii CAIM 1854 = LMG 25443 TaxID=1229493 RepID=A0A0C1ZBQ7_9VIBR|nr:hypothetical protein H735_08285 [Vibrio owensii CAIM 1854 = LMG 25443]
MHAIILPITNVTDNSFTTPLNTFSVMTLFAERFLSEKTEFSIAIGIRGKVTKASKMHIDKGINITETSVIVYLNALLGTSKILCTVDDANAKLKVVTAKRSKAPRALTYITELSIYAVW